MRSCEGEICHVSSQRIRLRFARGKGNKALMAKLGRHIAGLPAVHTIEANPRTGTVLIGHDCCGEEVISLLGANKEFPLVLRAKPRPELLGQQIKQQVNRSLGMVNKKMVRCSDGTLDVASLLGISLVGLALYQARNGLFFPAGLTMLLLAFKTLEGDNA